MSPLVAVAMFSVVTVVPEIISKYNEFDDDTVVEMSDVAVGNDLELSLAAVRKGRTQGKPVLVMLRITSIGDEWRFLRAHSLTLMVNGARMPLGETRRSSDVWAGGTVYEAMSAVITMKQLRQIAAAKSIRGQIGIYEFTIPDDGLLGMARFEATVTGKPLPPSPPAAAPSEKQEEPQPQDAPAASAPPAVAPAPPTAPPTRPIGLQYRDHEGGGAVVTGVTAGGAALAAGIATGDVIMAVGGTSVTSAQILRETLLDAGSEFVLVLVRDGQQFSLRVSR